MKVIDGNAVRKRMLELRRRYAKEKWDDFNAKVRAAYEKEQGEKK